VVREDGTIDVDTEPKATLFYNLEMENKMCCTVLTSKGYDGNKFKMYAPRIVKLKTLATAKPHTFDRVKVIEDAKVAGQMFHATGE